MTGLLVDTHLGTNDCKLNTIEGSHCSTTENEIYLKWVCLLLFFCILFVCCFFFFLFFFVLCFCCCCFLGVFLFYVS